MNTQTTTSTDETPNFPDAVAEPDDAAEARQLTPETEDGDPEEAGYGYGV